MRSQQKKILQINITANWGSHGKIAESIGKIVLDHGWEGMESLVGSLITTDRIQRMLPASSFNTYKVYSQILSTYITFMDTTLIINYCLNFSSNIMHLLYGLYMTAGHLQDTVHTICSSTVRSGSCTAKDVQTLGLILKAGSATGLIRTLKTRERLSLPWII